MTRSLRLLLVMSLILTPLVTLLPVRAAQALGPGEVTAVVTALQSLGTVVNSLSDFAGLGEPIPFTHVDPSEALNLDTLFIDALGELRAPAPSSLADLANTLNANALVAKDNPNLGGKGIAVQFNAVGDDRANTLVITFVATRTMVVHLTFAEGDVNLDGSDISLTFKLTAPFAFGYDGSASNASEKVFLTNNPTIVVTASANAPRITAFDSLLGFASVGVGGSLLLNLAINSAFADPDGNDRLTMDEWASTALGDLITVGFADGPGDDINGSLTLDTSIVPGTRDATIVWFDTDLTNGLDAPVVQLNSLDDFTNMNAANVLGGLSQLTTVVLAGQQAHDMPLPFVRQELSDLFTFAEPFVTFLKQQGEAAIVCTTEDGKFFNLVQGTKVFCRAITLANPTPGSVKWKVAGGKEVLHDASVGTNPTTVPLTLGLDGLDSVSVEFNIPGDAPDETHVVKPMFLTAQQLADKLVQLAGFDAGVVQPLYDADAHTLTYHLVRNLNQVDKKVALDFGDKITNTTGIIGLSSPITPTIDIAVKNITLDVTFGIILTDTNHIAANGDATDRFYLSVRNGSNEHELTADAVLNLNTGDENQVALEGRLAFLKVSATGDAGAPGVPAGTVFSLGPKPGTPSFAADISAPGFAVNGINIPNAIRLATLLKNLNSGISAVCSAQMAAGLRVNASTGNNELATSKVGISWPTVFKAPDPSKHFNCEPDPSALMVTPADFLSTSDLAAFNVNPDNPMALLSLILDALDGLVSGIEGIPDGKVKLLDNNLPLVGESPRDLLDGLTKLQANLDKIRSNPPDTLQDLEKVLEEELAIDPATLNFTLENLKPGAEKELIIRLDYNTSDTISETLNLDLGGGLADLVGLDSNNNFRLSYGLDAQLHVGVPLKLMPAVDDLFVVDTSHVVVTASVNAPNVGMKANVGPIEIVLDGKAFLNAQVTLENVDTVIPGETFSLKDFLSGVGAQLTGQTEDCDKVDVDDKELTGQACARLKATLSGVPLGVVGFRAEDLNAFDPDFGYDGTTGKDWFVFAPDLKTKIQNAVLDWSLLAKALPKLLDTLEVALDGGANAINVPLVGDALDGGAELVDKLDEEFVKPVSSALETLDATGTADTFATGIQKKIHDALSAKDIDISDVNVTCGRTECSNAVNASDIEDLQVSFLLSDVISATPKFDLGIPGVPLKSSGTLKAEASYKLRIGIGLSRADGPYVVIQNDGDPELDDGDPELVLKATVGLGDKSDGPSDKLDPCYPDTWPSQFNNFDIGPGSKRCLEGTLGFLKVNIHDGNGVDDAARTLLSLETGLNLGGSDRLSLGQLTNGSLDITPSVKCEAKVNLAIRTGADTGASASLPSVVTAFHLDWANCTNPQELTIKFDNAYMDTGSFVGQFLGPVVGGVRQVTSPLQPVVETLQAPLPVLSDLAELVGEDPITLISLMEAASGSDLSMVESLIALLNLANKLPECTTNCFISLGTSDISGGSFSILADKETFRALMAGPVAPDQVKSLINLENAGKNLMAKIDGSNAPVSPRKDGTPNKGTFGVPGLTFPFMDDAGNIFLLLMGQDVVLVHYDAGIAKATAGISYNFGPIMVGPIPIMIGLSGSGTIKGRFAMGYDTYGIRRALQEDGTGANLLDGIYIDDLDINGDDVPEIQLIGTVAASASIELVIVSAGVEGGIRLSVNLDLDDQPNPDGKLRAEEIADKLQNPICLFKVTGKLEAFLAAYVHVGFAFLSKTFRVEIANIALLDFSGQCDPESPQLAHVDSNGDLILYIGIKAGERNIQESEPDEKFIVRQLTIGLPARYSVTAFGITQEYPEPGKKPSVFSILAEDAFIGDDIISLESGAVRKTGLHRGSNDSATLNDPDATFVSSSITVRATLRNLTDGSRCLVTAITETILTCILTGGKENAWDDGDSYQVDSVIPFIAPSTLHGGDDNDQLTGGDGVDMLYGGLGNDKINGRGDKDKIYGEEGDDTLSGDLGADRIDGGPGNDTVTGGPGGDTIGGGDDDDSLFGGPWSPGAPDTPKPYLEGQDGIDKITGGLGDDFIDGGPDNDLLWGDLDGLGCEAPGMTGGKDTILGGPGNDTLVGGYGDDRLTGNGGHVKELWPYVDNDKLCGNAGVDTLDGDDEDPAYDVADYNEGTFADGLWGGPGNDIMYGRGGNDEMSGGADHDYMEGNAGVDTMNGDAGQDDMIGGSAVDGGADEGDVMHGGDDQDVMAGDNASISRPGGIQTDDTITRTVILHDLNTASGDSTIAGMDTMDGDGGNDDMYGGGENDTMHGNAGQDYMRGGADNDTMHGDTDNDEMYGNSGNDRMYGDLNDDTMRGGLGDDYMEGNADTDTMYGDAGQDDMIGGSAEAEQPDDGDFMFGNAHQDVMAGDNATITRPLEAGKWITDTFSDEVRNVVQRTVTLFDVATTTSSSPAVGASGGDRMHGESGFDILYGQGGGDEVHGDDGDDYLEGNDGGDTMYGDAGQDDLIGGTGRIISNEPETAVDGRLDDDDHLFGASGFPGSNAGELLECSELCIDDRVDGPINDDYDLVLGDNATIDRLRDQDGRWQINTFNAGITRSFWLYDVAMVDAAAADGTGGDDTLFGEASDDRLYGQGGDDKLSGGAGDDHMEGNAGHDGLSGDAGHDDMVGGTGRINNDPKTGEPGRTDGDDIMAGGAFFDVMAGDNALIRRRLVEGRWVTNTYNDGIQHERIFLLDIDSDDLAVVSGNDTMYGDEDDDVIYAQGRADELHGGDGHDYLEGNAGDDILFGNGGQDDMIGGTGQVNDDPPIGRNGRLDGADELYGEDGTDLSPAFDVGTPVLCHGSPSELRANSASERHAGRQWHHYPSTGQGLRRYRPVAGIGRQRRLCPAGTPVGCRRRRRAPVRALPARR